MSSRAAAILLVLCAVGCGNGEISETSPGTVARVTVTATSIAETSIVEPSIDKTSTASTAAPPVGSAAPASTRRESLPPFIPEPPYDIARGPTPPCRERDAALPARPFATQPIGDVDGDGRADRAVIAMRSVSDRDWRREVYVAYGSGVAAGPLRGTNSPTAYFGPTDVHGGADLDRDGRAELIVALNSNGSRLIGIARPQGCEIVMLGASDGTSFEASTEIFGHNCCPYQYAAIRCVQMETGVEIIATGSFPIKDDGTTLSGFDMFQNGPVDPLELNYSWIRNRWRIDGDLVRDIATESGTGRGRDLPPELVTSGLDCFGVRTAER